MIRIFFYFMLLSLTMTVSTQAQNLKLDPERMVFTAVQGTTTMPQTLVIYNYFPQDIKIAQIRISGKDDAAFNLTQPPPPVIEQGTSVETKISFAPASDQKGPLKAVIEISLKDQKQIWKVDLHGLSTIGLEGKNEPPLSDVLEVLGYKIDPGWEELGNHTEPELQGEEVNASLFQASGSEMVEMIPVARFSPDFKLPFGYYTPQGDRMPKLHQVGELAAAGDRPEHQITYPALSSGTVKFDPVTEIFGIFTYSPTHIAFSEDHLNQKFHPDHATHATRIYPLRDQDGIRIENAFLVCFEEAKNGDYQDYVFVLKNVELAK